MVILKRAHFGLLPEDRLDALDGGVGAGDGGHDVDAVGDGEGADASLVRLASLAHGRVDDEIDLLVDDQVDRVGAAFGDLVDRADLDAVPLEKLGGAAGGDQVEAQVLEALGDVDHVALVGVLYAEEDVALGREVVARGDLRLGVGAAEIHVDPHDFAGRLHFGSQDDVDALELAEREDRLLDREVLGLDLLLEPEIAELLSHHDLGRDLGERHADGLGDEGRRAGRTGVDLEHVDGGPLDGELDVHEAADFELAGQRDGGAPDALELAVGEGEGGDRHGAVARVDARHFDVLHDAGDEHVVPVGEGVDVDLDGVLDELVHEDGMVGVHVGGFLDVLLEHLLVVADGHGSPAEDVARANEDRVAQPQGDLLRLGEVDRDAGGRLRQLQLVDGGGELLAVLGAFDLLDRGAQDLDAGIEERSGQVERRLASQLDDDSLGL